MFVRNRSACHPPYVWQHPESQSLCLGQTAVFETRAGAQPGSILSFQWRKGCTPLSDGSRISGSTTPTLTITAVTPADAGDYDCVVTNPCACGEVWSRPATLALPDICCGNAIGNDTVDFADVTAALAHWGEDHGQECECIGDANGDGKVNFTDITSILACWGDNCSTGNVGACLIGR